MDIDYFGSHIVPLTLMLLTFCVENSKFWRHAVHRRKHKILDKKDCITHFWVLNDSVLSAHCWILFTFQFLVYIRFSGLYGPLYIFKKLPTNFLFPFLKFYINFPLKKCITQQITTISWATLNFSFILLCSVRATFVQSKPVQ